MRVLLVCYRSASECDGPSDEVRLAVAVAPAPLGLMSHSLDSVNHICKQVQSDFALAVSLLQASPPPPPISMQAMLVHRCPLQISPSMRQASSSPLG